MGSGADEPLSAGRFHCWEAVKVHGCCKTRLLVGLHSAQSAFDHGPEVCEREQDYATENERASLPLPIMPSPRFFNRTSNQISY